MPERNVGRDTNSPNRHVRVVRKRWAGLYAFATLVAVALAVAVAVRAPVHAADSPAATLPENSVVWNPGKVTYQVDASGCRTIQQASIDAATPEIADLVSDSLLAGKIKDSYSEDSGVKLTAIRDVRKNRPHIDLTIEGWLSNAECAKASGGSTQQAALRTGPGAGAQAATRVLGTVDLTRPDQVRLVASSSWFKAAVKVMVAVAVWVGVGVLTLGVIATVGAEGGGALAVASTSALAGCIGFGTADLIVARMLFPDITATVKERVGVAVRGCLKGAVGGISAARVGPGLAAGVRRNLRSTEAIVGQSGAAAAREAGVDLAGLVTMVDGVAEGGLRASK